MSVTGKINSENEACAALPKSVRLAVAIPTMNRPDFLRAALKSVAAQSRQPDEVYIFDNSAQADAGVVVEFPGLRIRYENLAQRVGVEEAFHRCISRADGDYVALLEDDNLWLAGHLQKVEEMIQLYPAAGVYGTQAEYVSGEPVNRLGKIFASGWPENGVADVPLLIGPEVAAAMHFFCTPICASALVINRQVYDRESLNLPGFGFIQDRWMWAQLAVRAGMVVYRQVTVLFRIHEGQISHHLSRERRIKENGEVTRALYALMVKQGLSPEKGAAEFGRGLTKSSKARWTVELFRSRQWDIIAKLLPGFRSTKSKGFAWPGAIVDASTFYARKLLIKEREGEGRLNKNLV